MQSKLQAVAAALWQTAHRSGKAGKQLDNELAVACYVKNTTQQLRLGRQNTFPSPREAEVCRAAFGVPDTAEIKTYVTPHTWHVWDVNSRTLMYQRCAANVYQKNERPHCESLS
jgi:hypothetical protein